MWKKSLMYSIFRIYRGFPALCRALFALYRVLFKRGFYTRTHAHSNIHIQTYTFKHTRIGACTCTPVYNTHVYTCLQHARKHACTHAHIKARVYTNIHTNVCANPHTCIRTHIFTNVHIYIQTYMCT